jgi:hypothetical protein
MIACEASAAPMEDIRNERVIDSTWKKQQGVLLYDRRHIVSGQRGNASGQELLSE